MIQKQLEFFHIQNNRFLTLFYGRSVSRQMYLVISGYLSKHLNIINLLAVGGNVAGTVRALNEMRHTPASPNVMRRSQQIAQQYQAEQQERQQRQEATIAQHRQVQSTSPFSPKYDAPGAGTFSYHSPPQTQEHQKPKPSGVYAKPQINLGTSSFKQTGHGKICISTLL